ncbi:ROK family protein [Nonomuraea rosea]|uniref:ROK family protein n=1 Tax=Nonomuraea rosea TaxID=638574 RepID=A0ABP6VXE3_9ACTN
MIAAISAFVTDLARTRTIRHPPGVSPTPETDPGAEVRLAVEAGPGTDTPPGAEAAVAELRPVAVGLAVPGLVTSTHAVFSAAFGWRDVPASAFTDVDLPVALGHDVRSAGEAELAYGVGGENVLFLPIGTGIAGAVVLSGSLYGGAGGWAGQIGHIPVWPDGLACGCGQRGCLAAYASGSAIATRGGAGTAEEVVRRATRHAAKVAAESAAGDGAATIRTATGVGDSAAVTGVGGGSAVGDARAAEVWGEAVEALALALATYTLLLDPARIVIGGGVAQAGDALLVPLRERLTARLAFRRPPEVLASSLGVRAGLMGAGLLGWRAAGSVVQVGGQVHEPRP